MKQLLFLLSVLLVVNICCGGFNEDFDTFSIGTLTSQESWEANTGFNVVATTTDSNYTGGRSLWSNTYDDKTTRHDSSGVNFLLDPSNSDGVEYGFDIREDQTSLVNTRMYLRSSTTYFPSVGFSSGYIAIRPAGESGTTYYGNNFASATYYGPYWEKGDWLRVTLRLTGTDFEYATINVYNLSRGGIEIPTGISNFDTGRTDVDTEVSTANRMNFRGGSGVLGTYIDNAYVKDYNSALTSVSDIYVSTTGKDYNLGTIASPVNTLEGALSKIRDIKNESGLPTGGIDVHLRGGTYYFDRTTYINSTESGESGKPVTIKPYSGETVIFDGSLMLDATDFSEVTAQADLDRLCTSARGNVYSASITDSNLQTALSQNGAYITFNGTMCGVSRFPNVGYAHVSQIVDSGTIWAEGRDLPPAPTYSMTNPIGAEFKISETTSGNWYTEFSNAQQARITGYMSYDWYKESHTIADIASDGTIQLLEHSRYGMIDVEDIPRRIAFYELLCELDAPGEWYYDEANDELFIYPLETMDSSTELGVWAGPGLIELNECSYVNIEGITVQGVTSGTGVIHFNGGSYNSIKGSTIRNCSRYGVYFTGGTENGMLSCDLYDLGSHVRLDGGVHDPNTITAAGNYVKNCHFTQIQAKDFYGSINIDGVGNIFKNNLVHNFIGQVMTATGCENEIEQNEIFNVQIEEGDGGAIYWAADLWTYDNLLKHNFLHHLMCVPQAHTKGGMYADQQDAGDIFSENVFYKAAHRAILLNGGAGHSVINNVFLDGYIGVYQTESYAQDAYDDLAHYDAGDPGYTRGDVGDYIWRTEQVVGVEGWKYNPWDIAYPLFKTVMNQTGTDGRMWPIECNFDDNMFYGNTNNFEWRYSWSSATNDISTVSMVSASDNRDIAMSVFTDPNCLNFEFASPAPTWAPDIPFEDIGLYTDSYRISMPIKDKYRKVIKDHWSNRESYDASATYNTSTINDLLYYNTGEVLTRKSATNPNPDVNDIVNITSTLSWDDSVWADSYDVYFGTNLTDVTNGTGETYQGNVSTASYSSISLSPDTTYYWAVDTIDPNSNVIAVGEVWSFSTNENVVITSSDTIAFDTSAGTYSINSGSAVSGSIANGIATYSFNDLNIQSGSTVTVTGTNAIKLVAAEDIDISSSIDVSGADAITGITGASASPGGGAGGDGGTANTGLGSAGSGSGAGQPSSKYYQAGGGGGFGGSGGDGHLQDNYGGAGGSTYGDITVSTLQGGSGGAGGGGNSGGGGAGGAGGGAIKIVAGQDISINADINADGGDGGYNTTISYRGGAGGSGGAIVLDAGNSVTIASNITLSANGGDGGDLYKVGSGGGGGGGGRIAIAAASLIVAGTTQDVGNIDSLTAFEVNGGIGGDVSDLDPTRKGDDGSDGTAYSSGKAVTVTSSDNIAFDTTNGTYSINSGTNVDGNVAGSIATFYFGDLDIQSGSTVTVTGVNPLILRASGNVDIDGTIDVSGNDSTSGGTGAAGVLGGSSGGNGGAANSGLGANGSGSGGGTASTADWNAGGGGGFGGLGGQGAYNASYGGAGGSTYGNLTVSTLQGGSGGAGGGGNAGGGGAGGAGGGAIKIDADGDITITGTINATGGDGGYNTVISYRSGAGGSGGAIVLESASDVVINANALLNVDGGDGGVSYKPGCGGGGGGGGRIAIIADTLIVNGVSQSTGTLSGLSQLSSTGGAGGEASTYEASRRGSAGSAGTIYYTN
ncbi:MAG: beta strand repeat-containing protein [Sedimentisphaeraceae bacterium JB056]